MILFGKMLTDAQIKTYYPTTKNLFGFATHRSVLIHIRLEREGSQLDVNLHHQNCKDA